VRARRGRLSLRRLQPPVPRRAAARQPAGLARVDRRGQHGARRQPVRDAAAPVRQEPAGEPGVPRKPAPPARRLRRGGAGRGRRRERAARHGAVHRTGQAPAPGLQLQPADGRPQPQTPAPPGRGARPRAGAHRRLGLLGGVEPRRAARRHALERRRPAARHPPDATGSGSRCCSRCAAAPASTRARSSACPRPRCPSSCCKTPTAAPSGPSSRAATAAARRWPWRPSAPHGGFTTGTPWLPVYGPHLPLAVEQQADDPGSMLAFSRALLHWRRTQPLLRTGSIVFFDAPEPVLLHFERRDGNRSLQASSIWGASRCRSRCRGLLPLVGHPLSAAAVVQGTAKSACWCWRPTASSSEHPPTTKKDTADHHAI
jgi:hypothetical protein